MDQIENGPKSNPSQGLTRKLDYDTLRDAKSQFRLLVIEPGDWSVPLKATIKTVNRVIVPAYDTISYTWGDAEPTKSMEVDGKQMDIRFNCWYALAQARYHSIETPIWIDSICINQDDLEEKSAQVSQMGPIFSEANVVYCSVGAHHGDSLWLCRKFEQLQRHFPDIPPDRSQSGAREDLFRSVKEKILQLNSNPSRFVAAYNQFCDRSYWKRLWTLQEIVLGQQRQVWCGESILDLRFLIGVASSYESSPYGTIRQEIKNVDYFTNLHNVGWADADGDHIDLKAASSFFERLSAKRCDNPRDLLYGSLTISRLPLVPDYRKSPGEVALEAMHSLESRNRHRLTREQLQKCVMAILRRMRVTAADPTLVEKIRTRRIYENGVAYRVQSDSPWCDAEPEMNLLENRLMFRLSENPNGHLSLLYPGIRMSRLEQQLPNLHLDISEKANLVKSKHSGLSAQKIWNPEGELLGITNIRTTPGDYFVYATRFNKFEVERFLILRPCKAPFKWHIVGQAAVFANTDSHHAVTKPDAPFLTYDFDAEDWVIFYAQSILPPASDAFDHILCSAATGFSKPGSKSYAEMNRKHG